MAKECAITGKSSQVGGGYSNRTRATQFNPTGKRRRYANIQKKKVFVPEIDKTLILQLSAKGIKTINKKGAYRALKDAGVIKALRRPPRRRFFAIFYHAIPRA
jgi:large subunit ribosomal protein L28